jgi:signal transduction histidine kinase/Na+/proline symporter
MPSVWIVVAAIAAYLVVLVTIGWTADRLSVSALRRRLRPVLHGLSLATLCSAWTYFGAVGDASRGSWLFLANALGPILAITAGYPVWRRIALLAKRENVGSLADFLGARYGKSRSLGIAATLVAGLGALPYIALQLTVLMSAWRHVGGAVDQDGWQTAFLTVVLAGIAILFGARRPSLTQHNRGLVGMLAFESVVKLVGLLAVAGLALGLFAMAPDGLAAGFVAAMPAGPVPDGAFVTLVMLCTVTAFTLPRQFHLGFVAIEDVEDSRTAAWIVPAYFTLWVIATLVIAVAIRARFGDPGVTAQLQVLALPEHAGFPVITLLALLGGLSAGAAMVVVELTAVSAMVSNEIVLPLLAHLRGQRDAAPDAGQAVLRARRLTIFGMALLAWLYFRSIHSVEGPTELGQTALTAFAQLMPALIGGIYWRRAHARGAIAGILAGMTVWAFAIAAPAFVADTHPATQLFALWPQTVWPTELAVWISLALNGLLYVVVSLRTRPRLIDTIQANSFVEPSGRTPLGDGRGIKATIGHLRALLAQFIGQQEADKALREFAAEGRHGMLEDGASVSPALARSAERLLAGVIGASSARNVVAIALAVDSQDAREISSILDEAGHAVHFNRELLQTTLDSLPQAVCVLDRQLALVAWNAAFLRFLALAADDIHIGKPLPALVGDASAAADAGELRARLFACAAVLKAGKLLTGEDHAIGAGADGLTSRIVQIAGRPLASGDLLVTLSDVSELRAAEDVLTRSKAELEALVEERTAALVSANQALAEATRQAEQATGAQRRFVAAASHDLVQPLHAARLFLGNALVSADEADPATPLLRKADQSVEGAHRLLHALLNLSRLEIGALEPRPGPVDLGELLASLGEEFAAQARTRGLDLVVMPTHLWVRSDRDLLRSMLQNLMLNALRYTPRGRVVVCARRRKGAKGAFDHVAIEVRDTGVGIAEDKLPRAFAEFSRLDEGQSLAAGAGLGLAIVARIADVLDHRLAVRSAPGRGSVFAVTLPLTAPVRRQIPSPRIGADLGGLTVLCVDDEHDVLLGTSALLERWGARVDAAGSCSEAAALGGPWDVVLADYHLGDGDGLALLRALATRARVRLLVTATPEPGWAESLAAEGIDCLTKPLAPLELQARLVAARGALPQDAEERSRASARS